MMWEGGGVKLIFLFYFRLVFDKLYLIVCFWVLIVNKRIWGNREICIIIYKVYIIFIGLMKYY